MTREEFQLFLDRISACWTDDDYQTWRDHVAFPLHFITQNGQVTNYNEESLRSDWELYQQNLRTLNITQIIRVAHTLEPADENTMLGTYHNQLLSGGTRIVGPYTSSAMLNLIDGKWRITSIMNALGYRNWTQRNDPI